MRWTWDRWLDSRQAPCCSSIGRGLYMRQQAVHSEGSTNAKLVLGCDANTCCRGIRSKELCLTSLLPGGDGKNAMVVYKMGKLLPRFLVCCSVNTRCRPICGKDDGQNPERRVHIKNLCLEHIFSIFILRQVPAWLPFPSAAWTTDNSRRGRARSDVNVGHRWSCDSIG